MKLFQGFDSMCPYNKDIIYWSAVEVWLKFTPYHGVFKFFPMYMLAYFTAIRQPIAVPCFCL